MPVDQLGAGVQQPMGAAAPLLGVQAVHHSHPYSTSRPPPPEPPNLRSV